MFKCFKGAACEGAFGDRVFLGLCHVLYYMEPRHFAWNDMKTFKSFCDDLIPQEPTPEKNTCQSILCNNVTLKGSQDLFLFKTTQFPSFYPIINPE